MVDKLDVDRLRTLVEAASPLPWVYRPDKYDDWGWIRGVEQDSSIGRYRPTVANAKNSNVTDEEMVLHRRAGTDPYGPNAALIVAAVNLIPTLLANAATTANGEQVDLAHELWALAQLGPNEGIEDGAARIAARLASTPTEDARVKVLEEALREFLAGDIDVSGTALIYEGSIRLMMDRARTALGNKETDRHG